MSHVQNCASRSQIPDFRRSGLSAAPAAPAAAAVTMRTLSQCKEATTATLTEAQPAVTATTRALLRHSSIGNGNGAVVKEEEEEEEESIPIAFLKVYYVDKLNLHTASHRV